MASSILSIVINAQDKGATGVLRGIEHTIGGIGKSLLGLLPAIGVGALLAKGFKELRDATAAAAEEEAGIASLRASVEATGASWGTASSAIETYLAAEAKRIALDDGDGRASISRLTQATGSYTRAIELLPLAADLARGKSIDLANAAEIVGKVAQGNTAILTRYGIVLDENATATEALAELQARFGGQAEAYAQTQTGAAARWQIALGNIKETIGGGLSPALTSLYTVLAEGAEWALPMMESAVNSLSDTLRTWLGDLGGIAARAFYWGANVVEQFAAGIEGSDAVVNALNSIGDKITEWLQPGSPPKLLPLLDVWGAGAAKAYFGGWAQEAGSFGPLMQDTLSKLGPILGDIDAAGGLAGGTQDRLQNTFGARTDTVQGYVNAYADLARAVRNTQQAQADYDAVAQSGDKEAINGARKKLDGTKLEENGARQRLTAEQRRLAARIRQEEQLTRAIQQQTKATITGARASAEAAAKAAQREAEAQARQAAAEAKRIADAKLAYELASTDTVGQIAIMRRELAATDEGSAEYYQTLTRIVQLERQLANERRAAGGAGDETGGGAGEGGADEPVFNDSGIHREVERKKIAWGEIGKSIGKAILDGLVEEMKAIPGRMLLASQRFLEWTTQPTTIMWFEGIGFSISDKIIDGIVDMFRAAAAGRVGDSIIFMFVQAALNISESSGNIGAAIAAGVMRSIISRFTSEENAKQIAESIRTAMVKALPYLTLPGQLAWLFKFMNEGAQDLGTGMGTWLHENVVDPTAPGGRGNQIASQIPTGSTSNSYNVDIQINAPSGNSKDIEIGVRNGLRAAGVIP